MSNAEHLRLIEGQPRVDPLLGRTVDGRYLVEGVLGEGGMGLVYKTRHVMLGKPLAMKVLRGDVSRDGEIITRFRQEAQSASAIGNEHIIDISDFGQLPDGSTYFVMEMLDGQELTKAIEREQPIPFARILHVAKQLCDALGAAHRIGVVHRDLKPDNVYLIKRGHDTSFVKVLDFGIAKVGGSTSKLTRAGQVFGTPHYMSPEQCEGSEVDQRTDVYAIGVILFEMVTGGVPFDADNLMGILSKHMHEAPPRPSTFRPDCPAPFEAIILRCLEKSKDARYQSCEELADDLARFEAGTAPSVGRTIEVAPRGRSSTLPTILRPSKRTLVVSALLLALLGAGGAALFVTTTQQDHAEALRRDMARLDEATRRVEQLAERSEAVVAPAESARIRLSTDPPGAEIYRGDELIGASPVELPRPEGDERLTLELRREGYVTRSTTLSRLTADQVTVTLARAPSSTTRPREDRAVPPTMAEPVSEMTTTMTTTQDRDILNPWE